MYLYIIYNYNIYFCRAIRYSDRRNLTEEDDEAEGYIDMGQVQNFTSCGDGLFCMRFQDNITYYKYLTTVL